MRRALYLNENRNTAEFGVLWVLNTHKTDCAAKCYSCKHWCSLCKKPPTPKLILLAIIIRALLRSMDVTTLSTTAGVESSEKKDVDHCAQRDVRNPGYCFSTEAWLFGGFLAREDLANFLQWCFAGFSRLLFPAFRAKEYILSYLNITNWPMLFLFVFIQCCKNREIVLDCIRVM